jgi:beta-mannosidase
MPQVQELKTGWELATLPAGAAADPRALAALAPSWLAAPVPGTVASALRTAGRDVFHDAPALALDAHDHFYRCHFAVPPAAGPYALEFEGLATLAEGWLNGEKILESDNMFLPARADVTSLLRADNELLLRFRALDTWLAQRRPRPRWRTRLVDNGQLRWARTSLLGRMPGWSPPVHAIGPWRPVRLISEQEPRVEMSDLSAEIADLERSIGRVKLRLSFDGALGDASAELWVGEAHAALRGGTRECSGELELPVQTWWPHTHGPQPLYPAHVVLRTRSGERRIELGALGFRRIELDAQDGRFQLRVNGVPIFCRGACWTTTDVFTLCGTSQAYARDLSLARAAGMNMLRISGTLFYEADEFYRQCDELGILVWQDFMFANLDYPAGDAAILASISRECEGLLRRTQSHACLSVLCGGSEVEQQAAMLGLPRDAWRSSWFDEQLPSLVQRCRPDVPYWPNTPSGGDLPFDVDRGSAHYYGVGAYLRPLDDARRCGMQFAAECLAFANLPDDAMLDEVLAGTRALVHDPRWKARVPRDSGASWDFEDVRDHYLKLLFECEPAALRKDDIELYLARSRVVTGEVIASALGEWRRTRSGCGGALIWFYRDLWPGAGLGLLDAHGRPKAAWYYARRALAPTCLWFTDEGLNGLHLHLAHESSRPLVAELRIEIRNDSARTLVSSDSRRLELPGRCSRELRLHALLPAFADLTRAYRFGPPGHDLVVASLLGEDGALLAEALYMPGGPPRTRSADLGLRADLARDGGGALRLRLQSERLAYAVAIEIDGYETEDNYLHVPPGTERWVSLRAVAADSGQVRGTARALNSHAAVRFSLDTEGKR